MLILNRNEVSRLLDMRELIDALESAFAHLARGQVFQPQRLAVPIPPHDGLQLTMPVYVGGPAGEDVLATKVVNVYPHNRARHRAPTIQAALLLYDPEDGRLLALMDAETMTALRTGAASGVATRHLAREDASTLLMVGTGALAYHQVEAVCVVRPITRVWVASRSGANDATLCAQIQERLGCASVIAPSLPEAISTADVICTATTATEAVVRRAQVRPGCHINAVGAFTPAMCEVDAETVRDARVFVDRMQAAEVEAGDLIQAAGDGPVAALVAGELGGLLTGLVAGRRDAQEITLFKSVGLAMQDAVAANLVYRRARTQGEGLHVDLA